MPGITNEMKKMLIFACLLIFPSLCFAVDYYAEYSFDEAGKISEAEIHGGNGWTYSFVFHWTRADIQNHINSEKQIKDLERHSFAFRRKAADLMSRMLRASADKRIFIIDTSVEYGPNGWLFIKISENEYVVFFTGS
jgi:hypothetical protein